MAERRRYTRKTKASAVIAAEMSSVMAAAESLDIPRKTVEYWFDAPEFATLRQKTRADMAEETAALAHKVLGVIKEKLPDYEPKDLNTLYGILVDKSQLLTGEATSRTESRDITDTLDDHEREALRKVLDEAMNEPIGIPDVP